MRIVSVEIASSHEGLEAISMGGLGETVVLAGRNGSGKSRILRVIADHVSSHCSSEELDAISREERQNLSNIENWNQHLFAARMQSTAEQSKLDFIKQLLVSIDQAESSNLKIRQRRAAHDSLKIDIEGVKPIPVLYQVRDPDIKDHRELRIHEISSAAENMASEFNINLARHYGLAALHDLINRYVYSVGDERVVLEADINRLKGLLGEFLGAELEWGGRDGARLFGFPVADAKLSDGQKVLLQVALSIFFQDGNKDGLILFLDEPENHLHPSAVVELVSKIKGACPKAQIWIATHSIHLLAQYESSGIWFVSDGRVEFSGGGATRILESLLGGDEGANQLTEFLALPTKYAVNSFAAQCMLPPGVCDTGISDPQTTQIANLLRERLAEGKRLRLLDFGMGKGRLLSALHGQVAADGHELSDLVEYIGFDYEPSPEDEALCRQRIALVYGEGVDAYHSGYRSLERVNCNSVDVIVMCNVLHEINPLEWIDVLGADGPLHRIIRPDGVLMIVEDHLLRVGERAHHFGFLVMDEIELRQLFGLQREDQSFKVTDHHLQKYRGRLKAHEVPASALRNVTRETRRSAVENLQRAALRELNSLQGEQYDRDKARAYAFWAHQHVNASLVLPKV